MAFDHSSGRRLGVADDSLSSLYRRTTQPEGHNQSTQHVQQQPVGKNHPKQYPKPQAAATQSRSRVAASPTRGVPGQSGDHFRIPAASRLQERLNQRRQPEAQQPTEEKQQRQPLQQQQQRQQERQQEQQDQQEPPLAAAKEKSHARKVATPQTSSKRSESQAAAAMKGAFVARPARVELGTGTDSDEEKAEALQCDPPPRAAPLPGSISTKTAPSNSTAAMRTKYRGPLATEAAADIKHAAVPETPKETVQVTEHGSGESLHKRPRTDDPAAPHQVSRRGPEDSAGAGAESQDGDSSGTAGAFCFVLDPKPQHLTDQHALARLTGCRSRSRSHSKTRDSFGSPASRSANWVEEAVVNGPTAVLAGIQMELQAMADLEGAQALLQQLQDWHPEVQDQGNPLHGPDRDRLQAWLLALERQEQSARKEHQEVLEEERRGQPDEVLRTARQAGAAAIRAIQQIMEGTAGNAAMVEGALTLEEELVAFANEASRGQCGLVCTDQRPPISAVEAGRAAADLWDSFGGVQNYAMYLTTTVRVAGADVPLSGGAAWHRLLAELEVATRLVHLQPEHLESLSSMTLQLQGACVLGGQSWEDMAQKLMHLVALGPLQSRARYAVVRMAWTLRRQKVGALNWLKSIGKSPLSWLYSSGQKHWQVLESNPQVRELVFGALDAAAVAAVAPLLSFFEAAICSGCQSPRLLLRPRTQSELQLFAPENPGRPNPPSSADGAEGAGSGSSASVASDTSRTGPGSGARARVTAEVVQRLSATPQLPLHGPSVPQEADAQLRTLLGRSFRILRATLVGHVLAFASTALSAFTNRGIDEAIGTLGDHPSEREMLQACQRRLEAASMRAKGRMEALQRCTAAAKALCRNRGKAW